MAPSLMCKSIWRLRATKRSPRLQLHRNDWYVRMARRLLQERAAAGRDLAPAHRVLREILTTNPDVTRQLRALWALNATGGLNEPAGRALLDHPSEHVRAWAIRLLVDSGAPSVTTITRFAEQARTDSSSKVRLSLASALQRIPVDRRWDVAEPLASHKEDASDRVLPLMIWYGVEPCVAADLSRAVASAGRSKIPKFREFVTRRAISADPSTGLRLVVGALKTADDAICLDLLVRRTRRAPRSKTHREPRGLAGTFDRLVARPDPILVERTLMLALDFQESEAISRLFQIVRSPTKSPDMRRRALTALVDRHVPGITPDLEALLDDAALRRQALRALAAYDDPAIPAIILTRYRGLTESERDDAIATLSARPASAVALLEAIGRGDVERRDLSVTTARQLQALGDRSINVLLERVWGTLQPTSREKASLMAKYKALLYSDQYPPPEPPRGRAVFNRTCLACHRLYDAGGDVGPELTGADRANSDYILENVLDPSASVGRDYAVTNIATTDGRVISGIIREQTGPALIIQTSNERIVVPREDVEAIKPSKISMMPEGQLERLSPVEIRDLFAYLASTGQVPLSPEK